MPKQDINNVYFFVKTNSNNTVYEGSIDNDGVYVETVRPIRLDDGRMVPSLVYLADRSHRQFAGKLPETEALRLIRQGRGATGSSLDYVLNTVTHLGELGLGDRSLERLARAASSGAGPPR